MTDTSFKTYWIVDGETITDFDQVRRLVENGKLAKEVSAESQQRAHKLRLRQERWRQIELERQAKLVAEQAHRDSVSGKAQAAARMALENPGGIVSYPCGGNFGELDQYSPAQTDVFK